MFENKLKEFGLVSRNISFKEKCSFKIGGKIKYFVEIESIELLQKLIKYLYEQQIPYFILGNGTNILASDEDFDIVVISLKKLNKVQINEEIVEIQAGASSIYSGIYLVSLGYDAVLPLAMIPGSIGGGIYMNASCFGESMSDYLVRVDYLDKTGKICSITNFDEFKYRRSPFMENKGIIIKGYFCVKKNKFAEEKLKKYWLCKKNNQPLDFKNAGCIFKNPNSFKTWQLIKSLNLDSLCIGDAVVSKKHANFLINKNHASFKDMKTLIDIIRKKVYEATKINLELEIKIIEPSDFIPYQL